MPFSGTMPNQQSSCLTSLVRNWITKVWLTRERRLKEIEWRRVAQCSQLQKQVFVVDQFFGRGWVSSDIAVRASARYWHDILIIRNQSSPHDRQGHFLTIAKRTLSLCSPADHLPIISGNCAPS